MALDDGQHHHDFLGRGHAENRRRTLVVVGVTVAMMLAEIAVGLWSGSMALLADGFHMASHAGTLTIAALAYRYAERHAADRRFTFGTGKVGDLAGFASAVVLAVVAAGIGVECCLRLLAPVAIAFDEALLVAFLGLLVNVACALVLGDGDQHAAGPHAHVHRDHNLRSAQLHVLADALTSVAAIVGLLAGRFLHWSWMDPLVGIAGAVMIARWSVGLLRDTGAVLLDRQPAGGLADSIRARLEQDGDEVWDLHLWRLGPGHLAAIVALRSARPQPPQHYRQRLADLAQLSHVTVEVTPRQDA